ncbi:diguanylate cyclase [Ketobacter sp.]|uniref:sensor domain-containing diguanylate cyclase n=1 Tax=Ketobacter sp. TaxID=2083498 RepID=UPI0025B99DA6|nr:diguanylate cyclase [Ketobacter sp.]
MRDEHLPISGDRYFPRSSLLGGLVLLLFLVGFFLLQSTPNAPHPQEHLRLDATITPLTLGHYTQYTPALQDETRPADVIARSPHWEAAESDAISLGYQAAPYWFHVAWTTEVGIDSRWLLEINNSHLDSLQVFLLEDGQPHQQWSTGDGKPYLERPLDHPMFVFPLHLRGGAQYDLYLLIENTEAMELPARLFTPEQFLTYNTLRSWIDGIFNGFLMIMAAYSIALFAILKDKSYLYYVSYILAMLAFFLYQQGILYKLVYPQSPSIQHFLPILISLYIFLSIALFFRELLQLPRMVPKHWLIYKLLLGMHAVYCLLFWVTDYQTAIYLLIINTILATLMAVSSIIRLAMEGSRSAQIVLVGWTLLLFFLITFTAAKTGIIYNEFMAVYGLRIGISFEILIFSFALSFRINQEREAKELALEQANRERNEKLVAQELALQREIEANQAKEDKLKIEIRHRENLELLVEERTADLERTLQELERSNRELAMLSSKDSLTGLYNRRLFDIKLEEYWNQSQRNQQPLSLLLVDIDHFKQINDTRGHVCGDHVLKVFARVLEDSLHRPTDLIARYGGEEFAILLADTPLKGAENVAEKIVSRVASEELVWEERPFHISVSVGVATRPRQQESSPGTLVSKADAALYQAKHRGRNRWVSDQ